MERHAIPTAAFRVFAATDIERAIEYVRTCRHRVVLKASGLAAGKGVLIPATTDDAVAGLRQIMIESVFGDAGVQQCARTHAYP
jgi:phosphoribosylamine--glycine ligase/phosphoribosylformylglycinamidine cyclo-ligase